VLAFLSGCPAKQPTTIYSTTMAILEKTGDLGILLLNAGVAPEALPTEKEVSVAEAERLHLTLTLLLADGSMQRYGPRMAAHFLMMEVIAEGKAVRRDRLEERLRRFERLAVLRPDGYLASASTGYPVQCVGPIQVKDGALKSGGYKVGAFYTPDGSGFREEKGLNRSPGR
jgi:hypothetical protein